MTNEEKLQLFERVANAFETDPSLWTAGEFCATFAGRSCYCAVGAAIGLQGEHNPRDLRGWSEAKACLGLTVREMDRIVDANDDALDAHSAVERIRRVIQKMWAK